MVLPVRRLQVEDRQLRVPGEFHHAAGRVPGGEDDAFGQVLPPATPPPEEAEVPERPPHAGVGGEDRLQRPWSVPKLKPLDEPGVLHSPAGEPVPCLGVLSQGRPIKLMDPGEEPEVEVPFLSHG